ncbi:hypothetical protein JCM8097_007811 [Rhodosporidiobolus ruineniae]
MSLSSLSQRVQPTPPLRALLLCDGNSVLPDRDHLEHGAQGGSLAAYALQEQVRRWISRTKGEECQTSVMVFGDLNHLSRTLHLSLDDLAAFSRGFSSTPSSSAFFNTLQSSTLSVMKGHLSWLLPMLDLIFLAGFTTDLHAHFLPFSRSSRLKRPEVVLLQTAQPVSHSLDPFVDHRTRFQGLMDVNPVVPVKDITDPSSDVEEHDGMISPRERSPPGSIYGWGEIGARPTHISRPSSSLATFANPDYSAQPSIPSAGPELGELRTGSAGPSSSSGSTTPSPSVSTAPSASRSSPSELKPAEPPKPVEQPPSAPTPAHTPASTGPLARPPPVPAQYLPLLQVVSSLERSSSGEAPLWSAVIPALRASGHKTPGGKFSEFLTKAQRDGWVQIGWGEREGREWVKVSQRGVRALKKGGK